MKTACACDHHPRLRASCLKMSGRWFSRVQNMTREQLCHIIRASAKICDENDFVVIGSQAIHASILDVDEDVVLRSMEADIYPLHDPSKSERLNEIGEFSQFHKSHGCYADPVDDKTAILPQNWMQRAEVLSGPLTQNEHGLPARAYCPELHDLTISKLIRGLEKDIEFVQYLSRTGRLRQATLLERLRLTSTASAIRRRTREYVSAFVPGNAD